MTSIIHHPRITVIIPVYNREKLLLRCLESVYAQDYRPVRVIVVDNASTDGTRNAAEQWKRTHEDPCFEVIVTAEPERGASAARQKGFEVGFESDAEERNDELVSFFDSDDVMLPGMLTTIARTFAEYDDMEMTVWRMRRRDIAGNVALTRRVEKTAPLDMHLVHSYLCTIAYAVRPETLRRAGGWRRGMMEWDDWELGVRLLLASPKIAVTDEVLAEIHCQADSITGTGFHDKAGKWERVLDMVEDDIVRSGRTDMERLRRIVAYRRVILAAHYRREGYPELALPLLKETLHSPLLNAPRRLLLKGVYHYTACGLRGAYTLVRPLL